MGAPLAYFITFHTYGTWLHGHEAGSVDRAHHRVGEPFAPANAQRRDVMRRSLHAPPLTLTAEQRGLVCRTAVGVCEHRRWQLHALHVRTTHVHAIITASHPPERVMNDLKAWGTRRLREAGLVAADHDDWSEHCSTRWVWRAEKLAEKVHYVLHGQGTIIAGTTWPPVESPSDINHERPSEPEA